MYVCFSNVNFINTMIIMKKIIYLVLLALITGLVAQAHEKTGEWNGCDRYDFQFKGNGYQGKYYGAAGFTYGYSTSVSRHLALEFSLGIGYLTTEYQKYTPYEGSLVWMSSGNYTFIGPTKAKISLVWVITKKRGRK